MYEWDEEKNRANRKKHGIGFEEAQKIFEGPVFTFTDEREDYGEERSVSIGAAGAHAVIVVAHTDRDGVTRIISARRATRNERQKYHDYLRETLEALGEAFKGFKK